MSCGSFTLGDSFCGFRSSFNHAYNPTCGGTPTCGHYESHIYTPPICGRGTPTCGHYPVSKSNRLSRVYYFVPQKINLEKEKAVMALFSEEGCVNRDLTLTFQELKKYQDGKYDRKSAEYRIAGFKIDKDYNLSFSEKYKEKLQRLPNGNIAWKKIKKIEKNIEDQREALKAVEEHEEDYER